MDLFAKAARYTRPEEVRKSGLYPYFRAIEESHAGTRVKIAGRSVVMAGSNNYLGLTHDPRVMEAAQKAIARYGTGCTGSRFLNGTLLLHEELEERLARFLGKEACITSGTGFQTNIGVISALMGREDVIFGDRDNHASIIDGCRLSFARLLKYKHNDVAELGRLLEETQVSEGGSRLVITDGVFSMLGDLAPLKEILPLSHRHEARVLVDDAHALGVLGNHGRGTGEHFGVHDQVDLIVGTFSKSFACLGGFLAGPRSVVELVKHTSRSVVFSASMTPASVATVLACLDIVEKEPQRRDRLWANVRYMKRGLQDLGLEIIDGGSPILSVVIGEDTPTFQFNRLLIEQGVFVNPVIPPAVPQGMSLLRTSYMATHTQEDLDVVLKGFKHVSEQLRISASRPGASEPVAEPVRVEPETGRAGRRAFLDVPYRLYAGMTGWIPPLRMAEAALQDRQKNPFFRHSAAEHFLAWRGSRVVGRVAAVENRRHNETHAERIGFFGFFDVEPDPEAATALLRTAADWCAARGLTAVRGPASYSTNDTCGLLVEGFDDPPALQMPWNRPDAEALVLGAGFRPVKDLIALWIDTDKGFVPERFGRLIDRLRERSGIHLRPIDFKHFDAEVAVLLDLYNRSWEKNWGFVPATEEEFRHAAKDLKAVASPEISYIAEIGGKPIGFSAVLRDVNAVLSRRGHGRLLPTNLFRLLFGLKRVRKFRVITLGVVPEARGKGVNEVLLVTMMRAAAASGALGVEASWVLADNVRMRKPLEDFGGRLTKLYRMYERPLPWGAS